MKKLLLCLSLLCIVGIQAMSNNAGPVRDNTQKDKNQDRQKEIDKACGALDKMTDKQKEGVDRCLRDYCDKQKGKK